MSGQHHVRYLCNYPAPLSFLQNLASLSPLRKANPLKGRVTTSRRKHHHQIDLKHTTYLTDLSIHVQAVDLQPGHCHLTDGKHDLGHKHMINTFRVRQLCLYYWVIQAWLLTPLTFTWHRLSHLAVFTSSAYFLHNGRQ